MVKPIVPLSLCLLVFLLTNSASAQSLHRSNAELGSGIGSDSGSGIGSGAHWNPDDDGRGGGGIPSREPHDRAFDRFITSDHLWKAINSMNIEDKVDAIPHLLEGEHYLHRPNKAISAHDLAILAARMSVHIGERNAVERMIRIFQREDDRELLRELERDLDKIKANNGRGDGNWNEGQPHHWGDGSDDGPTEGPGNRDPFADAPLGAQDYAKAVLDEASKQVFARSRDNLKATVEGLRNDNFTYPTIRDYLIRKVEKMESQIKGREDDDDNHLGRAFEGFGNAMAGRPSVAAVGSSPGQQYDSRPFRAQFQISSGGAVAERIESGSVFYRHLQKGDRIFKMDNLPVHNAYDLENHNNWTVIDYIAAEDGRHVRKTLYIPPHRNYGE